MTALYNEIEPYAVRWLQNLENEGLIAPGVVDERSIRELKGSDIGDHRQAHFFAGIGIWQLAFTLAGWPDDVSVWSGSCPCQPFSAAGRRKGIDDDRHLWPEWYRLIKECEPTIIFGEQVASADGLQWFDAVCADLERSGYTVGAADLCAAGIGAPHLRQRLYFVAYADGERFRTLREQLRERRFKTTLSDIARIRKVNSVGNACGLPSGDGDRAIPSPQKSSRHKTNDHGSRHASGFRIVEYTDDKGSQGWRLLAGNKPSKWQIGGASALDGATKGFWHPADWILCKPEPGLPSEWKWRPVEPGSFPLAARDPARVGKLRAYGNSIVEPLAQEFIETVIDLITE